MASIEPELDYAEKWDCKTTIQGSSCALIYQVGRSVQVEVHGLSQEKIGLTKRIPD